MLKRQYKRVVQLELNEISQAVLDVLIHEKRLPTFANICERWSVFKTSSESQYQHLEPWIQWLSAHTGKAYAEHQVFHLSDCAKCEFPQIWDVLATKGISSAIIGSMNATRKGDSGGIFFPDPWSKDANTHPVELQPLWNLIANKVQGHASSTISFRDLWQGLKVSLNFRLPLSLYCKIANQIIRQRIDPLQRWRLASFFDQFLAELFKHILATTQYGFYTLFLNSIAHYQHHYWRYFDNSVFNSNIVYSDCHPSDDPMRYGYQVYDRIIAGIIKQVTKDPDTLVIIASGLSQEPYIDSEDQGGMSYFRLRSHEAFVDALGLSSATVFPMMSRDWQLKLDDNTQTEHALQKLSSVLLENEHPVFKVKVSGQNTLFIETAVTQPVDDEAIINCGEENLGKFQKWFINTAIKSGHHIGQGVLYISEPGLVEACAVDELPITSLFQLSQSALGIT